MNTRPSEPPFIPIARPQLGEEEKAAVLAVLDSGMLAQGQRVAEFEAHFAELCGVKHAVSATSGTAALWLALLAHGIGPGDEVITTPFSFIASSNCILYVGAQPVFVDIEPDTYLIDAAAIEAKITAHTRAILPVHLYGQPCDMAAIMEIAGRHNLFVIEDSCQAHGATFEGQPVGSFGTGCFSFYPTKNMTTGEGGIVTTNDENLAERLRLLRNHGQSRRYQHDILGYHFRTTDIQAAIGLVQLEKLPAWNEQRIANARYLSERLSGVQVPIVRPGRSHVFHQYAIRVPAGRQPLQDHLQKRGIGTAIHYPRPIHHQPVYQSLGYDNVLPQAEAASREILSLPIHPALSQSDRERIVAAVNSVTTPT
ncbi:MAG: DegT/DnrJ/EryC1/StrS family aminotransferase [Chloroflexota bacterium]|nr:DegT/DnrJ/EryC1/StrS family aminotransferase [Chloroflexota bacterium]